MEERKTRVLIVDDEELNQELMADYMEILGFDATSVGSGAEALQELSLHTYDLVLLDIMMPVLDGNETARIIRRKWSPTDLPIIMVTALSRQEDRLKAVEAGANDFITKPVDKTELRIRVNSQLKLKHLHDELKKYQVHLETLVDQRTSELRRALTEMDQARQKIHVAHMDTIYRLGVAAEYKDEDTADHIFRVRTYCKILASGVGMPSGDVEKLFFASPMHDVGKIGIPDSILFKPGPLTEEEWVIMKQHTVIGEKILGDSDSELLDEGSIIAISHHEKWDGSGYPYGLREEDIPIQGRICAVADVFDALSTVRPYKPAFPTEKVLAIMREGRGSHFDPQLLDIFMDNLDEILAVNA